MTDPQLVGYADAIQQGHAVMGAAISATILCGLVLTLALVCLWLLRKWFDR